MIISPLIVNAFRLANVYRALCRNSLPPTAQSNEHTRLLRFLEPVAILKSPPGNFPSFSQVQPRQPAGRHHNPYTGRGRIDCGNESTLWQGSVVTETWYRLSALLGGQPADPPFRCHLLQKPAFCAIPLDSHLQGEENKTRLTK
jgi:hypothetical protein